ncbi:MAG: hypothetical protein L0229_02240 [Blastocatellia bacterium]|nr:hypothetical protein [Blastocatellia bacterium]
MKRIAFAAIVLALAVGAGIGWSSARPATQVGSELLSLLPDGSGAVIVDVRSVTTSNLWTTLSTQEKAREAIEKVQSEIGDLGLRIEDVQTVALAFPASGFKNITGAVTGVFNQPDMLSRLRADAKIKLTSENYKGVDLYHVTRVKSDKAGPDSGEDVSFAFFDAATIVFGNNAGVRAAVETRNGERPSIARNEKLAGALAETSPAAIRFALVMTPGMTGALQSNEMPLPDFSSIKLIFGSVNITSGIDVNATLRNDTAEHAQAIANQLGGLLAMAKGFLGSSNDPKTSVIVDALKTVTVTATDVDVKITGSLPGEIFAQVLK